VPDGLDAASLTDPSCQENQSCLTYLTQTVTSLDTLIKTATTKEERVDIAVKRKWLTLKKTMLQIEAAIA
jgi:hypothetical protein